MTKIADYALNTSFANTYLQANGVSISGNSSPAGIDGRIEVVSNAARLTVYGTDLETDFGHRSAVRFGTFPNSGECWSTVDFMIDPVWTTNGVATVGSWYPSPDPGEESVIKHVNIGLRIVDRDTLFVNVPAIVLPSVTSSGRTVVARKIEQGVWHNVTIRMNLSTTSTGWREVYLNRVKIYGEYNVPTAYSDANGPFYKMEVRTLVQDYDMVRMWVKNAKQWTGNESFTTTMGGVPVSPLRHVAL
jgi:hypothetical protein